jgi:hypothetical protein
MLRLIVPFILSVPLGFFALALAAQNEPTLPSVIVGICSPGLKVAEMLTPPSNEAIGTTMSWFLRTAIAINALFYFVILASLAYVVERAIAGKKTYGTS